MKKEELKQLLKDKDLTKDEDFAAVLSGINDDANSTISKRDETIEVLKKENEALKTNATTFDEEKKALEDKANIAAQKLDVLTKKNYIYKNINNKLEDDDIEDLLVLTNSKMAQNKDAKFEDVVNEVAKKRMFKGADVAPAVKANAFVATANTEENNKVKHSDALSWLGIKTHK